MAEMGRQRMREEMGIEHILDAMKSLIKCAPFQLQAAAVLWNLALDCTPSGATSPHHNSTAPADRIG
jgi:hypothetical protein